MTRPFWVRTAVVIAGVLTCVGCGVPGTGSASNQGKPAQVIHIAGSNVSEVILTRDAAKRIGLKTEIAGEVSTPSGLRTDVPTSALLYDENGGTWVFTEPEDLTFIRRGVTVERIDADDAILETGPAPGTVVVTVGAEELLGAEYGVEGA